MVSSNDKKIEDHLNKIYGSTVEFQFRPNSQASSAVSLESVLKNFFSEYDVSDSQIEYTVLIGIENPFRSPSQIDNLIDVLNVFKADSAIGVRPEIDQVLNMSVTVCRKFHPMDSIDENATSCIAKPAGFKLTRSGYYRILKTLKSHILLLMN